jgi:hypothetical protein
VKLRPLTLQGGIVIGYWHWCPACCGPHPIHTAAPNNTGAQWRFDGNLEAPTFSPSVNCGPGRCHYFIRSGVIEFCSDSQHSLAGQRVPLPDWPSDGDDWV